MKIRNAPLILGVAMATAMAAVPVALAAGAAAKLTATAAPAPAAGATAPAAAVPTKSQLTTAPVYDTDYPFIHYADAPVHNQVARLLEKIARGEVKLTWGPHGYLDSLLAALDIDPDSQVLVFSKTSLQIDAINADTPRAVYFNDDTYIGYVQKTGIMEVATMDADRGAVFYSFNTTPGQDADRTWHLDREAPRCLTCHDSFAESGGGVPIFMFESAYELHDMNVVFGDAAHETTEQDPVAGRWGGWYVTGDDGGNFHLGNILPPPKQGQTTRVSLPRDAARKGALPSLDGLLNVSPYARPTSDIVALMLLQNEVDEHNALVRANYKARYLYTRPQNNIAADTHWKDLPPAVQKQLSAILEPVVRTMTMASAAGLDAPVKGNTDYATHFQARGPFDPQGRSLRQLNLKTRTFKYPLTFVVYTEAFDLLPTAVREHLYTRFDDILSGRDRSGPYARLDPADCKAAWEILKATKPSFAAQVAAASGT